MGNRISTRAERRVDGTVWYRAECGCGQYRSGLHSTSRRAHQAGERHAASAHPKTSATAGADPFDLCR